MTYAELIEMLQQLTPEQQAMDVTIHVRGVDEYYPLSESDPCCIADNADNDVLDEGHPYLVI
jgi:hypothetical protein